MKKLWKNSIPLLPPGIKDKRNSNTAIPWNPVNNTEIKYFFAHTAINPKIIDKRNDIVGQTLESEKIIL